MLSGLRTGAGGDCGGRPPHATAAAARATGHGPTADHAAHSSVPQRAATSRIRPMLRSLPTTASELVPPARRPSTP